MDNDHPRLSPYFSARRWHNRSLLLIVLVGMLISVLAWWAVSRAWAIFEAKDLPELESCYVEDMRDMPASLATLSQMGSEAAQFYFSTDEGNYLRNVEQWRLGHIPKDAMLLGGLIERYTKEHAEPGQMYALLIRAYAERDQFISYRSVIFPLLYVWVIERAGCNSQGLYELRRMSLLLRLSIPVTAGLLVLLITRKHSIAKALTAGILIAFEDQLTISSIEFMPESTGVALLFLALVVLALADRYQSLLLFIASGLLLGFLSLIKFDFVYAAPFALLVAALVIRKSKPRVFVYLLLAFVAYLAVISLYAARNHELTGRYFITSKDAVNLWIGNSARAPERGYSYGLAADERPSGLDDLTRTELQTLWDQGVELALRDYYHRRLMERVSKEPWEVLSGILAKARILLLNGEVNLFPVAGRGGYALGVLINLLVWLGVVLWVFRRWDPGVSTPAAATIALYLSSFAIIAVVFFLPRFLAHLSPLAIIIAVCFLIDSLTAAWERLWPARRCLNGIFSCGTIHASCRDEWHEFPRPASRPPGSSRSLDRSSSSEPGRKTIARAATSGVGFAPHRLPLCEVFPARPSRIAGRSSRRFPA